MVKWRLELALVLATPVMSAWGCALLAGLEEPPVVHATTGVGAGGGGAAGEGGTGGGTGGHTDDGGAGGTAGEGGMGGSGGAPCVPVTFSVVEAIPDTDTRRPIAITGDATALYWVDEGEGSDEPAIRKLDRATGLASTLAVTTPKRPAATIVLDDLYVYWADSEQEPPCSGNPPPARDRVMRVLKTGGGGPLPVWVNCGRAEQLALLGSKLHWTRPSSHQVRRSNKDGTGVIEFLHDDPSDLDEPFSMALDDTHIYWSDVFTGKIMIRAHDVNTLTEFADAPVNASILKESWVALDDTAVFWSSSEGIYRKSKGPQASTPTRIAPANVAATVRGLALHEDTVYFTESINGAVWQVCKGGGQPQSIVAGQSQPRGIFADGTGVYWVNRGNGTLMRALR
ncbi:hypothetical protein [Chondromyces crocatus]|uniref:DUF5050 domain-containing protein n=1 Tax=Chondromyces crocatus TaxID=52 RepID=A0A0K1EJ72_CHOCO|nr:hypothetical protein [Chondromyces crocatus]AKT40915.1 uncharacterized protein CMC5_050720 [Chondromyces crocatus]